MKILLIRRTEQVVVVEEREEEKGDVEGKVVGVGKVDWEEEQT